MRDGLFVLAERTGGRLLNTSGVDVRLCEFFMVYLADRRFVCLFLSRLDAEMMRIAENEHGNRYEVMESSAGELGFFMLELKDLHCALIPAFAGTTDGRLYLNPTGRWSTCSIPLLPEDEAWLFHGGSKPRPDVVSTAKEMYAKVGLEGYASEVDEVNQLGEQELHLAAEEAMRCADVAECGTGSRLMVYSARRKSWLVGHRSV